MIKFYLVFFCLLTINFSVTAATVNPGNGGEEKVETVVEKKVLNKTTTLSVTTEAAIFSVKLNSLQKKISDTTTKKLANAPTTQSALSSKKLPCFEF